MPPKKKVEKGVKRQKDSEDDDEPTVSKGGKKRMNSIESDLAEADFVCDSKSSAGKSWNVKISSWNVNGLRAVVDKGGFEFLKYEKPDMFCVQETKCGEDKIPPAAEVDGYHRYWSPAGDKAGYAGVALYSKLKPIDVTYGIGIPQHDDEGRVITAQYQHFYLVTAYVPNAGRKLVRLDYRMEWDKDFQAYLVALDKKKPVILCGDLNVAHQEIDLANPKTNKKTAGFTQQERDGFSSLLKQGFVDSFRHLHPDAKGAYTFWTYLGNARSKNVGWRLDYFVLSARLLDSVCESGIRSKVLGSDHCPIVLSLAL